MKFFKTFFFLEKDFFYFNAIWNNLRNTHYFKKIHQNIKTFPNFIWIYWYKLLFLYYINWVSKSILNLGKIESLVFIRTNCLSKGLEKYNIITFIEFFLIKKNWQRITNNIVTLAIFIRICWFLIIIRSI